MRIKKESAQRERSEPTYEVVVHFNENTAETIQDKPARILLRELRRKLNEEKMISIRASLTNSTRLGEMLHNIQRFCRARTGGAQKGNMC